MVTAIFQSVLFLAAVGATVGIGLLMTKPVKADLTQGERGVVALMAGFIGWAVLLYFFAWLNLRNVSLIIVLIGAGAGWYDAIVHWKPLRLRWDWIMGWLIIAGILGQLFLVAPSGWQYADGIRFYGVNAHDAMWHVALMETLGGAFPPDIPTFAGVPLKGYHYLVDLWGSELIRIFQLSPLWLTFRFLPLLFAATIGCGIWAVTRRLTKSRLIQFLAVFLSYFGGSFGYLLPLFGMKTGGWETSFWAQQSISTFINLPLGASFAVLTAIFILFSVWLHQRDNRLLWLTGLLAGTVVGVKAYAGILAVGSFSLILVIEAVKHKKWPVAAPAAASIVLAGVLTLTTINIHKQAFIVEPGWFLKTMMEAADRVNYPQWEMLRQTYLGDQNYLRLTELWSIAFLVFVLGNFGVRLIGIWPWDIKEKKQTPFYALLGLMGLGGLILPLFLLQSGIVWNTIQFLYYTLFVLNILTAMTLDRLIRNHSLRLLAAVILISLTLPTTIQTIYNYAQLYQSQTSYEAVTDDQLTIFAELKRLPPGKVLTAYTDNALIPAFTGKSVYDVDQTQAEILQLDDIKTRRRNVEEIFCGQMKQEEIKAIMEENRLHYVLVDTAQPCHGVNFNNLTFLKQVGETGSIHLYEYQ